MKILIVGSKGQVGAALVQQCNENITLLALDSKKLDITDQVAVNAAVLKFDPDYIINAAAYTAVDKAETEVDLAWRVNRDGPRFLAQAAKKVDATIIHLSTDYVFSGGGDGSYVESDIPAPQSVYGESKFAGECEVINVCEKHIIIRTAWVFGENGNNFVKTMLRLGSEREELGVVADQFGGPTYAGDIAAVIYKIINQLQAGANKRWGIYHFSGQPYVSWCEFAKSIFSNAEKFKILKQTPIVNAIPTESYPTPARRPSNSRLNCDKIGRNFGIVASNWQVALENIQAYK
ncbi:dTDP-4-dehydrorhamnose reductase [Vibrio renipiscarius]|uniref:dTDP-4-dehydrorhamnose reductase n=1 Tax=Vibrio renipiscarius TaxID=1461322 RepID=UPI0035544C02